MANNITIKGRDSSRDDGIADGTVTPGDLIEQTGVSDNERTYARHSTAASKTNVSVALEGPAGKGIDDDHPDGEFIRYKEYLPGDEFYGQVFAGSTAGGTAPDVSANATLTPGDRVVSYGNGKFRLFDSANDSEGAVLAKATEAVDNSGESDPARVVFEVV